MERRTYFAASTKTLNLVASFFRQNETPKEEGFLLLHNEIVSSSSMFPQSSADDSALSLSAAVFLGYNLPKI